MPSFRATGSLLCSDGTREIDPDCDRGRYSTELIPSSPYLGTSQNVGFYLTDLPILAPNKLLTLPGAGLGTSGVTAAPPLPVSSLGGVQVKIQGITAKIAGVGPDSVTLIVPPV